MDKMTLSFLLPSQGKGRDWSGYIANGAENGREVLVSYMRDGSDRFTNRRHNSEVNMGSVRQYRFILTLVLASMVCTAAHAQQLWTGILAPARATNWSSAGVVGGIPSTWTQCTNTACNTVATASCSATLAQINSALSGAPNNTYVLLPACNYSFSGGIDFGNRSNVVLRGAGANQTLLVFTGSTGCYGITTSICARSADLNYNQSPSNTANWTAGYSQGATTITLSAVTNLKVGNPIILDQVDDVSGTQLLAGNDTGQVFICDAGGTNGTNGCSENGSGNQESGYQRGGGTNAVRDEQQIVTVTQCDGNSTVGHACASGTNITISPGLRMPNWSATKSPGAWWATSPIQYDGVENLSVDTTAGGEYSIQFFNCTSCWIKGVRSVVPGRAHFGLLYSNHITVRDSYLYSTQNAASESYGVETGAGSDNLVENNICQKVAACLMTNSDDEGSVYGYNFDINNWYSPSSNWDSQQSYKHSVISYVLFEGNQGDGIYFDLFHGTGQFITAFRNRFNGQSNNNGVTATSHSNAFLIYPYNRYHNIIGNVAGQSGYHTTYTSLQGSSGNTQDLSVFVVGTGTVNCCSAGDPLTVSSLMRWGNYDTVSAAVRFVSSEVPSAFSDTTASTSIFVNPVPASQILPNSFYYAAKPAWWPATKAWPAVGPDVTGGNIANVAGHAYTIPAQDCYTNTMSGPANGVGNVLSFNASTCYSSGSVQLPAPPTNLKAVVQPGM